MDDLGFGFTVTALGLTIVFGLLAVLWLLLALAGRLDARLDARRPSGGPDPTGLAIRPLDRRAEIAPELVAAIAVAISRHVELRRREAAPVMRSYWPGTLLFASRWVAAGRMRQGQSWRRRGR
jgi:glutaconyl-CoA/methylmalonyl-CoA decarboxylase subunit delta